MMGDRKHLTGIEVERLIAAIKGSLNEKRERCLVPLRNIQHTVRYTATNPARFERLWR